MNNIKYVAGSIIISLVCWLAYDAGYDKARVEGELALEQIKLAHAQEIIEAQNKVKVEYNEKVEALNSDLNNARQLNAERLRQLSKFNSTSRDLETCRRDLNDVSTVAVGLESIALKADSYLGTLIKH